MDAIEASLHHNTGPLRLEKTNIEGNAATSTDQLSPNEIFFLQCEHYAFFLSIGHYPQPKLDSS